MKKRPMANHGIAEQRVHRWIAQYSTDELFHQAKTLPLRQDMMALLTYVRDNKVVGTQSTGNMPLKHIRTVTAQFVNPPQLDTTIGDRVYKLRTETDIWSLYFLHILAEVGGLLKTEPGKRWKFPATSEIFVKTNELIQVLSLLLTWWHQVNWLVAYPIQGMGESLPPRFNQITLKHLRACLGKGMVPFEPFADGLIKAASLTWTVSSPHTSMFLQSSIERMVIAVLKDFGAARPEYGEKPLGTGTITKLIGFEITKLGEALLTAPDMQQ